MVNLKDYCIQIEDSDEKTATRKALEKARLETGLPNSCFDVKIIRRHHVLVEIRIKPVIADKYKDSQEYLDARKREEEQKQAQKQALELQKQESIEQIKSINDIYEYKTVCITDTNSGKLDGKALTNALSTYSKDGWRLVNSIVNESGKESNSVDYGMITDTTDIIKCETYLVFERCIKRWR